MISPHIVVINDLSIAATSADMSRRPDVANCWNVAMIPTVVPRTPSNGATTYEVEMGDNVVVEMIRLVFDGRAVFLWIQ